MFDPTYFNHAEREVLLTETAAARSDDSDAGPGVVLIPSQRTLCTCRTADDARLITKLFNGAMKS